MSTNFKISAMQDVRDYVTITIGLLLFTIGFTFFQLPYEMPTGALAGVGAVVFYGFGFPAENTVLIVNALLLIVAVRVLGLRFCIKTIYAVIALTFVMRFVREGMIHLNQIHPDWFVGTNPKSGLPIVVDNMLLSCILGASLNGIGIGVVLLSNGSTGGTDIIASIINKYKDITLGQMLMLCDVVIISSNGLLPDATTEKLLYGYCTLVITNLLVDYVVDSGRQSVQFFIFSRKYTEIAEAISSTHRGVTVLDGQGWYTKEARKVLVVMAKKRESTNIFRIIQGIDPAAFVSQSKVIGVFGEGFDRIKVKAEKKTPVTNSATMTVATNNTENQTVSNLPTKLVFATNNEHKLSEIRAILGEHIQVLSLSEIGCHDDIPETADTLEGNALIKARWVKERYGYDCFADDTGLEVKALNGGPGVHTARYAFADHLDAEANTCKLLSELQDKDDRSAQFRTVIALIMNGKTLLFEGVVKGEIATEKRGTDGFGYDPVFIPENMGKTFAELGVDVKNQISHRARAVQKLTAHLSETSC